MESGENNMDEWLRSAKEGRAPARHAHPPALTLARRDGRLGAIAAGAAAARALPRAQ